MWIAVALLNISSGSGLIAARRPRTQSVPVSQMSAPPTPNNNAEADSMASTIAYVLNAIVTNPLDDAWFYRYGLENADKCAGNLRADLSNG
jgi:phosphate-induced protein 1